LGLGIQVSPRSAQKQDFVLAGVVVGTAVKGVLLGPTQIQAGDDMGDLDSLRIRSHPKTSFTTEFSE
jgi:hypothetical protein